jgi:hypothetical protein
MIEYPHNHRDIVDNFLNGRFILHSERLYSEVKEHEGFYKTFFKLSFGYELTLTQEYAYILSEDSNENLSRDISIFFAILCYELDKTGKNFLDELEYGYFGYRQIDELFENSSYSELIASNNKLKDGNARKNLFNEMSRRNIIEKESDEAFTLTPAYKVFIEYANELARKRIEGQAIT